MKIAVIGAGISGLTTAHLLNTAHDITVFEQGPTIGGHAQTIDVPGPQGPVAMDAGVCMFQSAGYRNFFRLLKILRIPTARSDSHIEILRIPDQQRYHFDLNAPLNTLASSALHAEQRWLISDGLRFYQHVKQASPTDPHGETFGEHWESSHYSEPFRLLVSFVCGATWTINQRATLDLPLHFVCKTFEQLGFFPSFYHGTWHHVPGSVGRYLRALAAPLKDVRLQRRVDRVERDTTRVTVHCGPHAESFDQVVFALPAQKALAMIDQPTAEESDVLSAFETQSHHLAFTSDEAFVSRWTTSRPAIFAATEVLTQDMEKGREFLFKIGFTDVTKAAGLQGVPPFYMWYQFPDAPRPENVHAWIEFSTPTFTQAILAAQQRHAEISGRHRLHFCGSGWANGIHEGAVESALAVTRWFGKDLDDLESA